MISMPHLLSSLLLAQSPIGEADGGRPEGDLDITSESDCPSSQAVREALALLRPPADWPNAEVAIRATQDSLSIDFGERSSIRRQIAVGPECVTRASSAALVIATWMDDLPAQAARAPVLRAAEVASASTPVPTPDRARYEIGAGLSAAESGGWAPGLHAEVIRLRHGHRL